MKYLSLFTGIGGLESGLEKIGAECVGYSEIKESSVRIYDRHYPGRKNFGDITKVVPKDLPDFDVLIGGFPCQSFSLAGLRKGFRDRRGLMIFYIYEILKEKKPEYAVLENVKGIVGHDRGQTFRNVIGLLAYAGYNVRVVLLNALNYGSAQSRERIFFLCSKKDFPRVTPEILDNTKLFRDIRDSDKSNFTYVKEEGRNIDKISQRDLYSFCLVGGYDRVATITTSISGGGGRNPSSQQKIIQEKDGRWRYLTELEAERLQGFPEGWTKGEGKGNRWYALGNAVNCKMSDYLFTNYLKKVWSL